MYNSIIDMIYRSLNMTPNKDSYRLGAVSKLQGLQGLEGSGSKVYEYRVYGV